MWFWQLDAGTGRRETTEMRRCRYDETHMNWKHIVAGLAGFAVGFWLCIPRDTLLQQRWEVRVVDPAGNAIPGASVRELRRDYATGAGESTSLQTADSFGRVAFQAVRVRSSPLLQGAGCAVRMVTKGVQASCRYTQEITVAANGYTEAGRTAQSMRLKERGSLLKITLRPAG